MWTLFLVCVTQQEIKCIAHFRKNCYFVKYLQYQMMVHYCCNREKYLYKSDSLKSKASTSLQYGQGIRYGLRCIICTVPFLEAVFCDFIAYRLQLCIHKTKNIFFMCACNNFPDLGKKIGKIYTQSNVTTCHFRQQICKIFIRKHNCRFFTYHVYNFWVEWVLKPVCDIYWDTSVRNR